MKGPSLSGDSELAECHQIRFPKDHHHHPHFTDWEAKTLSSHVTVITSRNLVGFSVIWPRDSRRPCWVQSWALRMLTTPQITPAPQSLSFQRSHSEQPCISRALFFFFCILSFKPICGKRKLLLISSVKKSCSLASEKEPQLTAKVVEPIHMFGEVNLLLSYLLKRCHPFPVRSQPSLLQGFVCSFCERGSVPVHLEN